MSDEWSRGYEYVEEYVEQAAQLVDEAREVLNRAVIYARERNGLEPSGTPSVEGTRSVS